MKEFKGYHIFEDEGLKYFMNHIYPDLPWYKRILIKTKSAILYIYDDGTKLKYILDKSKFITWVLAFFSLLIIIVIGCNIYLGLNKICNFFKKIGIKMFNFLFND